MKIDIQWQIRIALALALVLLVWPVVHMAWSLSFGLSSWKLAGWGMYATNHPFYMHQKVIFLPERDLPVQALGPFRGISQVVELTDGELRGLEADEASQDADSAARRIERDLRAIRSKHGIGQLVDAWGEAMYPEGRPCCALVLFTEPRLDVLGGRAYRSTTAFYHEQGKVHELGRYRGDQVDEAEIARRIDRAIEELGS
ncbi:MAG: hypothetical protein AAF560_07830 [Acidobacteriota bacterium]